MKNFLISVPSGLETELFALGPGALQILPQVLEKSFPGLRPWIVADENTFAAAGKAAMDLLRNAGLSPLEPYIFPGSPRLHPDFAHCEMLAGIMPENCVPVAVGSGVVNDLTKCAASLKSLRYCCVPTACSVDGYTAAGAALVVNGSKKTVKCPAPKALCADTEILATAPADMFASGYADLLTKIPAGVDWIIADTVGEEPIRQDVWKLIQGDIFNWTEDHTDMLNVFNGLAATGYSMQMYGESRPASGAEHLFSHVWEMEGLTLNGQDVSHGFKVGVGLLASTLLMEFALLYSADEIKAMAKPILSLEERATEIDDLLKLGCYGSEPKNTALKKYLSGEAADERRKKILDNWDLIRQKIGSRLVPFAEMREKLRAANCPVSPQEIGLTPEQFRHGIHTAQLIRNRYTVLDLLYELGVLDEAVKTLDVML